jgi:N-acetylmuramoyl-L-alanine amidase
MGQKHIRRNVLHGCSVRLFGGLTQERHPGYFGHMLAIRISRGWVVGAVLGHSACAFHPGVMPPPALPPEPTPPSIVVDSAAPRLPPIPRVTGPLELRVVYPPAGAQIATRDSNFIFGSVGSGDAQLTINGIAVPVYPNGSFLGFLPVPPWPSGVYELVATRGSDTVRLRHQIRVPPPPPALPLSGPLTVDSGALEPRGRLALERWEPVRVAIRAPSNATVELQLADGSRLPLLRSDTVGGPRQDPNFFAVQVPAVRLNSPAWLMVWRGRDTVRLPLPRVALADSLGKRYAILGTSPSTLPDTDRVVIARPLSGGTYKWFLLPRTVVEVTGRIGTQVRVRLDRDLAVYVDSSEVTLLPPGTPAPRRIAGNASVRTGGEWSDLRIPLSDVPPYSVDVLSDALLLTLYGTVANTDILNFATQDPLIRRVTWRQVTAERAEYRVELLQPLFGYLVFWDRGVLVLRVRRPPLRQQRPAGSALRGSLDGLVIAVDAGHPPAGATGPTGLYEAVATLAIAERLRNYLEGRGATVLMTRTGPGAVALYDRPLAARRANAHAFVSIHLNALPDGVNPFQNHGTGSYYFNPFSETLAREVQRGMLRRMGLRDLGVNYDNLAVLRPTWMPSVLCEGAFIMIPEQEAALRTAEFQDAYARGVAEGIEAFFAGLESQQHSIGRAPFLTPLR